MSRPANPVVRERLLAAGVELMHTNSFHGSGVKEIANRAVVPKGSFYSYYASKDVFAAAVLAHYWAHVDRDFGPHLRDSSLPPVERLTAFFRAMTDDNARRDFTAGCLIGNLALEIADHSPEARTELGRILDRWTALVATAVGEAQRAGAVPGGTDAESLAAVVIEAWEGAVMQGRVRRCRDPYDRFTDMVLPRLLQLPVS
ncbi:TetR family transcriptional regulator C-terminal domain-containing protein [Streptomyces sp. NPDC002911]